MIHYDLRMSWRASKVRPGEDTLGGSKQCWHEVLPAGACQDYRCVLLICVCQVAVRRLYVISTMSEITRIVMCSSLKVVRLLFAKVRFEKT